MATSTSDSLKPDYGIDAPVVLRRLIILGVVGVLLALLVRPLLENAAPSWFESAAGTAGKIGIGCLIVAGMLFWGSKVTKFRMRDRVLDSIPWRGDEHVLDVGCGHGLMLIGAAKRAVSGRAVGVDVWREYDQADNKAAVPLANARIEDVAGRVDVRDGDARELPFEDESFDVVVSSLAIHNIDEKREREQAIREMVRVLKPGGHIGVLDILRSYEYARVLRDAEFDDVKRKLVGHSVLPVFQVTGRKPIDTDSQSTDRS